MSEAGKRLRISLIAAVAAVSANVYSVVTGTAQGFYADLSGVLVTAGSARVPSEGFAAFEPQIALNPGVD